MIDPKKDSQAEAPRNLGLPSYVGLGPSFSQSEALASFGILRRREYTHNPYSVNEPTICVTRYRILDR